MTVCFWCIGSFSADCLGEGLTEVLGDTDLSDSVKKPQYLAQRVWAISDLHVDYSGNRDIIGAWSDTDYQSDCIIVAGDLTDDMDRLRDALSCLKSKFSQVFFVPGNHELWVRKGDHEHSVAKFEAILSLCKTLGLATEMAVVGDKQHHIRIVPLFSWYTQPEEADDHLYYEKNTKDETHDIWSDFFLCRWPDSTLQPNPMHYFSAMNEVSFKPWADELFDDNIPVISFSHFLPRQDLVFPTKQWRENNKGTKDPLPQFNFTRVAGSSLIEHQLRHLGASMHVYGHQHRNRWRSEEGVRYVSHCLGYPRERKNPLPGAMEPKLLWEQGQFAQHVDN